MEKVRPRELSVVSNNPAQACRLQSPLPTNSRHLRIRIPRFRTPNLVGLGWDLTVFPLIYSRVTMILLILRYCLEDHWSVHCMLVQIVPSSFEKQTPCHLPMGMHSEKRAMCL
jgi:hypothetical protein